MYIYLYIIHVIHVYKQTIYKIFFSKEIEKKTTETVNDVYTYIYKYKACTYTCIYT